MSYVVTLGEKTIILPPGETLIGRDAACVIRLDDLAVSRRHARLLVVADQLTVEDIKSLNGVLVNGAPIDGPTVVKAGDQLKIGEAVLTVSVEEDPFASADPTLPGDQVPPLLTAYQAPIYRTCTTCRHLLEADDKFCMKCGASQTAGKARKTVRLWRDPRGRRSDPRVPVQLRGVYVSASVTVEGNVSDLSRGGAFFSCELYDAVGTHCDLLVFPTAEGDVLRFAGEVMRIAEGGTRPGIGLRFHRMSQAAYAWLAAVTERAPG